MRARSIVGLCAVMALSISLVPTALGVVTVTNTQNTNTLMNALLNVGNPIIINNVTLNGHSCATGEMTSGTYGITAFPDTYGFMQGGIVLSSGDARDYGTGPNTIGSFSWNYASCSTAGGAGVPATAAQEAILDPITGGTFTHYDTTELIINFDVPNIANPALLFEVTFGSDEYPEFQGTNFIDGFGIIYNGVNQAFVAGQPVNINHAGMTNQAGTELDGVLAEAPNDYRLFWGIPLVPGSTNNTINFIVGDATDGIYDTTVYIAGFGVPEPATLGLLGIGVALLLRRRVR